MATAAEKEYQAYLVAQQQAQMMADRARTTSRSRGSAAGPAIRSAGDLSRYAIGGYSDDPGSYPAQYYGGGESGGETAVYGPPPISQGPNPYAPGAAPTQPAPQPGVAPPPSPSAPAPAPQIMVPQPGLTQLNAGLNYQASTPPTAGNAGWNPAWGQNPLAGVAAPPQVAVPEPTLLQIQNAIAAAREQGVNLSEAMAVAILKQPKR